MNLIPFPEFDTIEWNTTKRPEFKTNIFEPIQGKEVRHAARTYPKYIFKLSLTSLIIEADEDQLADLLGFMLNKMGMLYSFLYTDPNDNRVIKQKIDDGDGVTRDFQLVREYGGKYGKFKEPVQNINIVEAIYDNDEIVDVNDYSISDTGIITLNTALEIGHTLTWTGSYYYRVRFTKDGFDCEQLMYHLHQCKDIEFIGSVVNLV